MATRGRKPKPTVLKLAHGNPGKHHLRSDEPVAPFVAPEPPESMAGYALESWKKVTKDLYDMAILSTVDLETIVAFCQAAADQDAAIRTINAEGYYITTERGGLARHPACAQLTDASNRIDKHGASLGLNPAARSRIVAPSKKNSVDEFKKFLKHG